MNVKIFLPDDADFENCEFDDYMRIEVDGKPVFSMIEGGDMSDCKIIPTLLEKAYEAGRKNEKLIIIRK